MPKSTASATPQLTVCAYEQHCSQLTNPSRLQTPLFMIQPCHHTAKVAVHDECMKQMGRLLLKCDDCYENAQRRPLLSAIGKRMASIRDEYKKNPADTIVGTMADAVDFCTGVSKQLLNDKFSTKIAMNNSGETRGSQVMKGILHEHPKTSQQHLIGRDIALLHKPTKALLDTLDKFNKLASSSKK